jgi:hypothetical protein
MLISYKSDRPRPDELLPEYQGNVEEVAAATIEDDMIQLAEYQEASHMDSMPGDNENEDIQEDDTPSFEEYQEICDIDSIPSDNEDEDEDEDIRTMIPSAPIQSTPISMSLPPIPPTNGDSFYSSEPIHHIQNKDCPLNDFELGFGLWCEKYGASRPQYEGLRQLLKLLGPHPLLDHLPECVDTLKQHVKDRLPLLPLRKRLIPLLAEKLPSISSRVNVAEAQASSSESPISITEELYFFDPKALFESFLSSPAITSKMFTGFGQFQDPKATTQLWHSQAWTSSIRSTSGRFAKYIGNPGEMAKPLLPSKFVWYSCNTTSCHCRTSNSDQSRLKLHIGRITDVGEDFRSVREHDGPEGCIAIKIQAVEQAAVLEATHKILLDPPAAVTELILIESSRGLYVRETAVQPYPQEIFLDRTFQSSVNLPTDQLPPPSQPYIRRIWNSDSRIVRPLWQSHALRAELEIQEFGEERLLSQFFNTNTPVLSVPLLAFIDGFGLYRNTLRNIMGFYLIMAAFSVIDRNRRANVIPLTLGPHGSNFDDVVKCLEELRNLDAGTTLKINGTKTNVCVFIMSFIGDMPQQMANCGLMSQRSSHGCRHCELPTMNFDNLHFDANKLGRYHHEILRQRTFMESLPTKAQKLNYCKKLGMAMEPPVLRMITPALNLILTRPSDPAHSEYGGITKQVHLLLINAVLTKPAALEYAQVLRKFPKPPGWGPFQNPIHYIGSYSLSEHARWSIVAPILFRVFLRERHMKDSFKKACSEVFADDIARANQRGYLENNTSGISYIIVRTLAAIAKSNHLVMSNGLSRNEQLSFSHDILFSRLKCQKLFDAAAMASNTYRGNTPTPAAIARRSSRAPVSRAPTPMLSIEPTSAQESGDNTLRAIEYHNAKARPNVHVGMHHYLASLEFGLVSHSNVLIGEEKHRQYKKEIYHTNYNHPERDLLNRESFQQTVRLLLLDSFKESDPELTMQIKHLHDICPDVLDSFLSHSEKHVRDKPKTRVISGPCHLRASVLSKIKADFCFRELMLPTRASGLDSGWRKDLFEGYKDYHMVISHAGNRSIKWYKRFSFNSP